jgi:hypothetical protein
LSGSSHHCFTGWASFNRSHTWYREALREGVGWLSLSKPL